MKKAKIISIVALLAAVIGLAGLIVFLTPGQTKPDKIITKYVSAINAGKTDKMKDCTYSFSDMAGLIGNQYSDFLSGIENYADEDSTGYSDELYGNFVASVFDSASELPSDLKKLKSIKVVGCVDGKEETQLGITGLEVKVVLKMDYVDAEGQKQTAYSVESVGLIKVKNKYYIVG